MHTDTHGSRICGWLVAVIAIAALFAIGTSILSWDNVRTGNLQSRFHWPDETTNWFFASRVAAGESLAVPEPRNVAAGNLIHPRTANVRADGALVPGAYLGMPLWYGLVGRAFGTRAMLFLTPLFAALGLIAFATIVARLAGRAVAVIATALLALHPALWLFTATAMLPNVPFVALLLCGVAVLLGDPNRKLQVSSTNVVIASPRTVLPLLPSRGSERGCVLWHASNLTPHNSLQRVRLPRRGLLAMTTGVRWLLGGALVGLALTLRTHELAWVVAIAIAIVWHARPGSRAVLAGAVGIALPFVPILILNAQFYGSPFTTGYSLLQEGGALPTEFVAGNIPFVGVARAFIAPFGWHPIEALARFWQYMVVPYWWFIILAIVGIVAVCRRAVEAKKHEARMSKFETITPKIRSTKRVHDFGFRISDLFRISIFGFRISISSVILTMMLTVWLVSYYGSWTLADPLVRDTNVLTISYARYWLPIVVLLAPWAARGFVVIVQRAGQLRHAVAALLLLAIALTSGWQIVRDPLEGLVRQRQAIAEHRARARAVVAVTSEDAVIVSHRMDKVFFPERAVVYAPEVLDEDFEQRLTALLGTAPVFWYAPSVPMLQHASLEFIGAMPFNELLYRVRAE